MPARDLSRKLSVVLTDRVSVGILPVRDLVALGRYPHADFHIEIFAQDQRITWCTRRNGSVREHHSVYDLIAAIQKESWPVD
ncbi:MAG: hypothetical protein OXH16_02365 [Gemmatimonadetes bacterium]|nr:hypothetical protein [Gemmatimonadota bacterium]